MKTPHSGRALPRASMLVAILALVAASGGFGYAAGQIGTNQIKNNAVTSAKIKNSNVKSPDIRNGNVKVVDLHPAARQASFVKRLRPQASATYDVNGFTNVMTMPFRTSTPGLVRVNAMAVANGGSPPAAIVAVVDYTGNIGAVLSGGTVAQLEDLYDHLAYVQGEAPLAGGREIPVRVGAGAHTVQVVASGSAGHTVTLALRSTAVDFTGGVQGTYQKFSVSRTAVRELLRP